MRRLSILVFAALAAAVILNPLPTHAQDILGLSVRPTDLLPAGTARGTADIVRTEDGTYLLTVDLSSGAEALSLDDFTGATDWVVWVVDMDGMRYNVGTLDDNLVLADAPVEVLIARIFVTAESAPDVDTPSEDRVYVATLRDVEEVGGPGQVAAGAAAEDETAADTEETEEAEEASAAATDEDEDEDEDSEEATEPEELPTTGTLAEDLAVLALVAAALLLVGLRMRTVRI